MAVKDNLDKVKGFWGNRTTSQKIQLILVVVATLVAIIVVVTLTTQTKYDVLYYGMATEETSQIYNQLREQGVEVQLRGSDTILVPEKEVDNLRMQLAAEGLPHTGYTYDYINTASSFGQTEEDKKTYTAIQLQENIAKSIRTLAMVEDALVQVTLPSESKVVLSSAPQQVAQAAVTLTLKSGAQLSKSEVAALYSLIRISVPSLADENISIVDTNLNSYAIDADSNSIGAVDERLQLQKRMQEMLEEQVGRLFTPVYGEENFVCVVNVRLNFDEKSSSSVRYEPPTDADNMGIIISKATEEEYVAEGAAAAVGNTGLDPNGGIGLYAQGEDGEFAGPYYRQTEEFNAEVNEFREELQNAKGVIEYLSVSISINSQPIETDDDEAVAAREATRQSVLASTAMAVGVDQENISVQFMPFDHANQIKQDQEDQAAQPAVAPPAEIDPVYLAIAGAALAALLALVLILLFTRRRHRRELAAMEQEQESIRLAALENEEEEELSALEEALGRGGSDLIKQIRSLVDKNPEPVAQILRNWLSDEYR